MFWLYVVWFGFFVTEPLPTMFMFRGYVVWFWGVVQVIVTASSMGVTWELVVERVAWYCIHLFGLLVIVEPLVV